MRRRFAPARVAGRPCDPTLTRTSSRCLFLPVLRRPWGACGTFNIAAIEIYRRRGYRHGPHTASCQRWAALSCSRTGLSSRGGGASAARRCSSASADATLAARPPSLPLIAVRRQRVVVAVCERAALARGWCAAQPTERRGPRLQARGRAPRTKLVEGRLAANVARMLAATQKQHDRSHGDDRRKCAASANSRRQWKRRAGRRRHLWHILRWLGPSANRFVTRCTVGAQWQAAVLATASRIDQKPRCTVTLGARSTGVACTLCASPEARVRGCRVSAACTDAQRVAVASRGRGTHQQSTHRCRAPDCTRHGPSTVLKEPRCPTDQRSGTSAAGSSPRGIPHSRRFHRHRFRRSDECPLPPTCVRHVQQARTRRRVQSRETPCHSAGSQSSGWLACMAHAADVRTERTSAPVCAASVGVTAVAAAAIPSSESALLRVGAASTSTATCAAHLAGGCVVEKLQAKLAMASNDAVICAAPAEHTATSRMSAACTSRRPKGEWSRHRTSGPNTAPSGSGRAPTCLAAAANARAPTSCACKRR